MQSVAELNYSITMTTFTFKGPFTPTVSINTSKMLAILLSLRTMDSLQNRVATHFGVIVFIESGIARIFAALTLTLGVN